ncbi:hypothetical protein ACI75Y_11460 [Capnocytophaga stomatis]|uniref:DUF7935 family protein n=1 Tax=Capnocytophaga stomatis TaxID=1848904 RepID=UPI00194DB6E9|nr:hypothetical protein [Capnocytophaga stomatis]GIJ94201.1 hypothetical protein CAPN002_14190 [Capnocytophaga stomatis]
MESQIVTFLLYCVPSAIVGAIAYYFFYLHIKNEEKRRYFLLQKENQKLSLPLRLQAYERMALFLERISPQQLLLRIPSRNLPKKEYEALLVNSIDEEFEHNLSQQIYMSEDLWNVIRTAKMATIQVIRKATYDEELADSKAMTEFIFKEFINKPSPSSSALSHLKDEVREFLR